MKENSQPNVIAITMGCPVGIGPEIILKSYKEIRTTCSAVPVVVGDSAVLQECASQLGMQVTIVPWSSNVHCDKEVLYVCHVAEAEGGIRLDPSGLQWGRPDQLTGKAMASYINHAVKRIGQGEFTGLVTCPITKSALNAAGFNYPGHTEMLAELCSSTDYAMMMAGNSLRVTLVTIHQALCDVPRCLSTESVCRLIDLTARSLQGDFGIAEPTIAVAGLNPHAGEDGLFGQEEKTIIEPAVKKSAAVWNVQGPFPPDTVFTQAVGGKFDAVVCMYHDQGLIPFKLLHFSDGVNVTIGLPIVRTSVDHGTAYDIAGKGIASPESLKAAYQMASDIVRNRCKADMVERN